MPQQFLWVYNVIRILGRYRRVVSAAASGLYVANKFAVEFYAVSGGWVGKLNHVFSTFRRSCISILQQRLNIFLKLRIV
jgi:hypothetical protein